MEEGEFLASSIHRLMQLGHS